jgi:hypothetical protein
MSERQAIGVWLGRRLDGMLFIGEQSALLKRQFSEPSSAAPTDREAGASTPPPAGSVASEDDG